MIINGNCLEELDKLDENSVDAIVTDPPYELNFMGKGWDNAGVSFQKETWEKCLRVLKPGGYLLAFGGTRTYHRIACAIEDAGFEIRDTIMWLYGSGFPKSMNIGLAIDKKNGVESEIVGEIKTHDFSKHKGSMMSFANTKEQETSTSNVKIKKATNKWKGWGTALKPSFEPIIVARKPFKGSLVDNVIKYGVGGINIDECRVSLISGEVKHGGFGQAKTGFQKGIGNSGDKDYKCEWVENTQGRFPANTILTYDETDYDEVCGGFPNTKSVQTKGIKRQARNIGKVFDNKNCGLQNKEYDKDKIEGYTDSGSAARYFYCAKASRKDRDEGLEEFEKDTTDDGRNKPIDNPYLRGKTMRHNTHPTVKPTSLMQYLIRLVAPKGATILDPFMGSGSTGKAVMYENKERDAGYKFIGIELSEEYCKIAKARIGEE